MINYEKIAKIDKEDIISLLDIVGNYFDSDTLGELVEIYIDLENEEIQIRGIDD